MDRPIAGRVEATDSLQTPGKFQRLEQRESVIIYWEDVVDTQHPTRLIDYETVLTWRSRRTLIPGRLTLRIRRAPSFRLGPNFSRC